ncbi:MAG: hypothetical protein WD847_18150 [Pirellulales bacterium]
MQCDEFEPRLNEVLDAGRRPQSDPALAEHQAHCPDCRRLAASYQAMLAVFAQANVPQASGNLAGQVLLKLRAEPAAPRRRRLIFSRRALPRLAAAALAAAVIAAVATPLFQTPDRPPDKPPVEQIVETHPPPPPAAETAPPPRRIQNLAEAAHDRYQGLARETGQSFSVAMQIIPGVGGPSTHSALDSPQPPDAGWTSGVANGLKPVTRSTAGALHALFKAVALPEDEAL